MLLTLDLATMIGWTCGHPADQQFAFGHHRLPSTGPDIGAFACAYGDWLHPMLMNVTEVVMEAPILPKVTSLITVRKLSGLAYHTEMVCHEMKIRCYEAHLQSVKKFVGGSGRASKLDMIEAVRSFGYDTNEENEADAIAVRCYTIATRYKNLLPQFNFAMGLLGGEHDEVDKSPSMGSR